MSSEGRERWGNWAASISARPAWMVAMFLAWAAESTPPYRRSKVSLKVPRRVSPAPCAWWLVGVFGEWERLEGESYVDAGCC